MRKEIIPPNRHVITAIIYDKKGNILSIGKNSYVKTHTLQAHYAKKVGQPDRQFLHAEIHALARCKSLKSAHRIMVSRFGRGGEARLAKPCKICLTALQEMTSIRHIEWTTG